MTKETGAREKMDAVLYIHGKGGSAAESGHYKPLFPDCTVTGLDYQTFTPWETGKEIRAAALKTSHENNDRMLRAGLRKMRRLPCHDPK